MNAPHPVFTPCRALVILAVLVLSSGAVPGQESGPVRLEAGELLKGLSVSATVRWLSLERDFGLYWNDAPAAGLEIRRSTFPGLSMVAGGMVSFFRPAETPRQDRIPDLGLLTLHIGLRGHMRLAGPVSAFAGIGLETQTFGYIGPKARGNLYARIESELGAGVLAGVGLDPRGVPPVEVVAGHHVVFLGPEYAGFTSIGLNIRVMNR